VSKLLALSAFTPALAIPATAASRQEGNPELRYYADAYADHYGVPRALVHAIIAQESNWNPHALSNKGAAGLMQLMPATAEMYLVRNRFSVTENLSGGILYLADLMTEFRGEMRLAVAAYYCGSRHIARQGLNYPISLLTCKLNSSAKCARFPQITPQVGTMLVRVFEMMRLGLMAYLWRSLL
jgi:soluble lytic murein transglycosylase-like protein